ncbi:helix-turn-helix transcriptional regulator [Rhizobium alvei]|uniref:Helix-turn-helix transcriptional regulator n=1 Tax=Rhizobium alvei TaxID=1132659 RepID=A0ABT8YL62_9HYPH|nr:helix-turn-helix transcriptional regulator [Rhizobium alvei]MDO6964430.1 helix-turn-helix transcriptional regulator [Rhizobium alvei]
MDHFNSAQVNAVARRFELAHKAIAAHVGTREFSARGDFEFETRISVASFADHVTLGRANYSPVIGRRTAAALADNRDGYLVTRHRHDHEISVAGRTPFRVRAGDVLIVSDTVISEFHLPRTSVDVLYFDRKALETRIPSLARNAHALYSGRSEQARVFFGYADLLMRHVTPKGATGLIGGRHLVDLAALLPDQRVDAGAQDLRLARTAAIRQMIADRCTDLGLTIAAVARAQSVTPRYVQQLLAADGTSFSDCLRACRLDHAASRLRNDKVSPIARIAFDSGFSDLSTFNRAFRRHFGVTPSEFRDAAAS